MSEQAKRMNGSKNEPSSDTEDEEVFFDARYPPEEETVSRTSWTPRASQYVHRN